MPMQFEETAIAGVRLIRLDVRGDARGQFMRRFCAREFAEAGLPDRIVQVNHSVTIGRGTARGLHYQLPPHAEDKLVGCTFGKVFDVAVDLRRGSPTFLQWVGYELDQATALFVPKGCAHGFQSLTEEAHLVYMSTEYYAPDHEAGVLLDDPAVGIAWPLPFATRSDRDLAFAPLDPAFEGLEL